MVLEKHANLRNRNGKIVFGDTVNVDNNPLCAYKAKLFANSVNILKKIVTQNEK